MTHDLEAENARLREEVGKARLLLSAANQDMAGPVMAEANRNSAWHVLDAALSPPSAIEQIYAARYGREIGSLVAAIVPTSASKQSAPVAGSPDAWRG